MTCSSYLLRVSSADRNTSSYYTSTDFKVSTNPLNQRIATVELKEVVIPFSIYNVISGYNYLNWSHGASNYSVPILPGAYNINTLMAAVEQAMNTADSQTYTLTYDQATFKINFVAATDTFTLDFSSDTTLYKQLGFALGSVVNGVNLQSNQGIELDTPLELFIQVEEFGKSGISTARIPFTFSVAINVAPGEIFFWDESVEYKQEVGVYGQFFGQLTVKLVDSQGAVVDLNGRDWSFLLKVNVENSEEKTFLFCFVKENGTA